MKSKIKLVFSALLLIAGLGCGIKGPPLPPLDTMPTSETNASAVETKAVSGTSVTNKPAITPASPSSTDNSIKK